MTTHLSGIRSYEKLTTSRGTRTPRDDGDAYDAMSGSVIVPASGAESPRMSHPWISQAADPAALADARIAPERIGYLNAHASSTPLNEPAEARAIHAAFGALARAIPVSGTRADAVSA